MISFSADSNQTKRGRLSLESVLIFFSTCMTTQKQSMKFAVKKTSGKSLRITKLWRDSWVNSILTAKKGV